MGSQILYRPGKLFSMFLICSGLMTACTSARPPTALEKARADYLQASNDSALRSDASADLFAAQSLLQQAEASWQENEDYDETAHFSYLTTLKIDLARANAELAASNRNFEQLSAEKDKIRLQARDSEIEQLKAKKVPEGIMVSLGDVLFDTAHFSLKPGSLQKIYPLVEYLKNHPQTMVKIEGHTDSRGSAAYNEELSQRRAAAVSDFLVSNGIEQQRITVQGMGENFPVATNSTAAGRQQNRRVDVTVIDAPRASGS